MKIRPISYLFYVCPLLLLVVGSGCSGNKRQVVTGVITLNGEPLGPCVIRFHGAEGYLTTALLQAGGKFSMTDVLPGEYKVTIKLDEDLGSPRGKRNQPAKPATDPSAIPRKYLDPSTTDLIYTITPNTTFLDIQLK
jgi:hypothetical protein